MSNWWPALPGPGVEYRPVPEWQQMAIAGALRADDPLFDPVRGVWSRAADHPDLLPYFAQSEINRPGLLGLAALALLAWAVARELANEGLCGLVWADLKREIFRRDGYVCVYCGHRGNALTLHVDHIVPRSRGGSDDPGNLATACWPCNLGKGTRTGWEYRLWRLLYGR